jgi:hypothetical protein
MVTAMVAIHIMVTNECHGYQGEFHGNQDEFHGWLNIVVSMVTAVVAIVNFGHQG